MLRRSRGPKQFGKLVIDIAIGEPRWLKIVLVVAMAFAFFLITIFLVAEAQLRSTPLDTYSAVYWRYVGRAGHALLLPGFALAVRSLVDPLDEGSAFVFLVIAGNVFTYSVLFWALLELLRFILSRRKSQV